MKKPRRRHATFPVYLKKGLSTPALRWIGRRLAETRNEAKKTARMVAQSVKVDVKLIQEIEKGLFGLNVGLLRTIVHDGYNVVFEDLLAECYEANRAYFDQDSRHRFDRDYHYSVCREGGEDRFPTAFLIGGAPKKYLWAIPMRRLKKQPIVTELLELAPLRTKKPAGATPENSHPGIEVVHVIHGAVNVRINSGFEAPTSRHLKAGDSIHFHSTFVHKVQNTEKNTAALLFVVRLPMGSES
jgi:hypothetical protein